MKVRTTFVNVSTAITLLLLMVSASVRASTIYVDAANTTGVEDGTQANPYNTIQEAMDAATAIEDSVEVAPGIYYGAIELKSQVDLVSSHGPEVTIIDGMAETIAVKPEYIASPSISISGFTVRNAGALIEITNRVYFWALSYLYVDNCILTDAASGYRTGIRIMPGGVAHVTRTVFSDLYKGIDAIWCPAPQITNVTVDNVGAAFFIYQISINLHNVNVTNVDYVVALWGSNGTGSVFGSHNNFHQYGDFSQPSWSGRYPTIYATNSFYFDPMYVDLAAENYRLQKGSPLIDAGVDVRLPFVGSAPDIGAYEFGSSILLGLFEELAQSYQDVSPAEYKNVGEQRRNALTNKFAAVLNQIRKKDDDPDVDYKLGVLYGARNMLVNDIWAKADGFYGGDPADDWIVTEAEQAALYPKVMELLDFIDAEIEKLSAK